MEFDPDAYLASEPAIATTFADPEDLRRYRAAKARGLSDQQAFKVGDNGVGKWGDDTTRADDPIVAVPRDSPAAQHNQLVEVSGPAGTTVARVADVMPKRANIRNGATIDLNPAASAAVGATGKTPVNVRVLRNPAEGFDPDAYLGIQKQPPQPQAVAFNPDAYLGTEPAAVARSTDQAEYYRQLRENAGSKMQPVPPRDPNAPDPNEIEPAGPWSTTLTGIGLPRPFPDKGASIPEQAANAVMNLPVDFANFALSPAGAVTGTVVPALPAVAQRLVAAGFTIDQIKSALQAPDWQSRIESMIGAGVTALGVATPVAPEKPAAKPKMQTVGKSFADIPESVAVPESAPIPDARTEPANFDPNGYLGKTGTVIEPGTIPVEGLPTEPAAGAARPNLDEEYARASAHLDELNKDQFLPAPPVPFHEDESIPFMTKVRIEDELKAGGLTDEHIAQMTTPAVQGALDQMRASKPPPTVEAEPPPAVIPGEVEGPRTATSGTPSRQAEQEYQQSLLEESQQYQRTSGDEFLSALVESGGLPSRGSPHRSGTFTGEIARLEEFARDPNRAEPIALNRLFRNDAPHPDELATRMRDRGFDTPTADDVYTLAEQRLRTGQEIYGKPPQVFASGSASPRGLTIRPTKYRGEDGFVISGPKTSIFTKSRESAELIRDKINRGEPRTPADYENPQGKLFASGAAAPAQPHQPSPRPAPAPRTPPPSTPAVAQAVAPLKGWWLARTLGIRKLVAPQTIDRPARMVANIVRDYNGQLANRIIQADHALAAARADFDRTPVPTRWQYDPNQPLPRNYAFMAESEKGGANLSTSDRALKAQLDKMFEDAVDEVHRVKPTALQSLIQDYFPHIWQDPAAAQKAFASIVGTRPLEGSKSFLKKRALAYIEEGLKLGLRPVSDNPIDVVLTKLHEVHKFVAAQDILVEAKAIGARKFVYIFEKPPEGWAKVDDPSSRVNAPPFVTVAEAFDEQMKVKTIELLDNLGIKHQRVANMGGKRWGDFTTGGAGIRTKFAGPLSVYWHELGHALQERYQWLDIVLRGERPGGQSPIAKELRALADLRAEGQPPNKSFKSYIRNADEKAAVLLEAYMHAPQRMRDVAPLAYGRVQKFIAAHPELSGINDIRPSLVLGRGKMDVPVGGLVTLGHYYMPEGAATVLSNYLSPGLQRFGLIRTIRQSTNILSGLQLGFSAFHAGFTSIDAAVSQFALGLRYASEGKFGKAAAKIVTTPAAPITNYLTGREVQRAMVEPGYGSPDVQNIAQLAVKAGLRATVDPFWKTQITRNMMRAWHEGGVKGYAGTVLRLPFAASEQMMRPILEYLVPRQKLGVFAGMAQQHMERLGPNADIHAVRDAMARAADATEDRMGQMTYDNLFYNRIVRDMALLGFRAYGWTFGKYRALFGGVGDVLRTPSRISAGEPVLTDRMAYLLALPMVAAGIGSVMNYTMTGQAPQDWRDALMPRTGRLDRNGNPERLSLPTYIKDILSDWHDFPSTKKTLASFGHKLNPWLSVASDLIFNADFFNTKISNEDDPALQQAWAKVKFVMASARPFSVTSTLKLNESNPTLAQQLLPFFGFVPAKAALSLTPAQARAAELMADMLPQGARTSDQAEHAKLMSTLLRDRRADDPGFYNAIEEARATGQLHMQDRGRIERASQLTPFQYQLKRLSAVDAMKVWDLSSDDEKMQIRGIILQKIGASKTLTSEQRTHYTQVIANSTR